MLYLHVTLPARRFQSKVSRRVCQRLQPSNSHIKLTMIGSSCQSQLLEPNIPCAPSYLAATKAVTARALSASSIQVTDEKSRLPPTSVTTTTTATATTTTTAYSTITSQESTSSSSGGSTNASVSSTRSSQSTPLSTVIGIFARSYPPVIPHTSGSVLFAATRRG